MEKNPNFEKYPKDGIIFKTKRGTRKSVFTINQPIFQKRILSTKNKGKEPMNIDEIPFSNEAPASSSKSYSCAFAFHILVPCAPSKRDFNSFEEYRQYKVTQSNLKHAKDFIENFSSHTPIKTSQLQPFFIDATNTNIQKKSPLDVFEMKPPVFDGNKDHAQQSNFIAKFDIKIIKELFETWTNYILDYKKSGSLSKKILEEAWNLLVHYIMRYLILGNRFLKKKHLLPSNTNTHYIDIWNFILNCSSSSSSSNKYKRENKTSTSSNYLNIKKESDSTNSEESISNHTRNVFEIEKNSYKHLWMNSQGNHRYT
ncbi:hypothetical protein U3516DRAFT_760369 [Neocallimastix sp. 'constans']